MNEERSSLDRLIQLALECHRSGRFDEAARLYQKALKEFPTNPKIPYYLAMLNAQMGRVIEALEWASKALRLQPGFSEVFSDLGVVFHQQGHTIEMAVQCGATILILAIDQSWGDRVTRISDPVSHVWNVTTSRTDGTS